MSDDVDMGLFGQGQCGLFGPTLAHNPFRELERRRPDEWNNWIYSPPYFLGHEYVEVRRPDGLIQQHVVKLADLPRGWNVSGVEWRPAKASPK